MSPRQFAFIRCAFWVKNHGADEHQCYRENRGFEETGSEIRGASNVRIGRIIRAKIVLLRQTDSSMGRIVLNGVGFQDNSTLRVTEKAVDAEGRICTIYPICTSWYSLQKLICYWQICFEFIVSVFCCCYYKVATALPITFRLRHVRAHPLQPTWLCHAQPNQTIQGLHAHYLRALYVPAPLGRRRWMP